METLWVLIVDDELGMRKGVERALQGMRIVLPEVQAEVQLTVESAESGEEGLQKIQNHSPDILLLDHQLPGMSGLDVLEKIDPQKDMHTVMITAHASLETAVTAIKRGAYDFLAKPFTPKELKGTVSKAAAHLATIREAKRLAQEKKQVRFQFISVLAHELKAPLGAVEGYLDILKNRTAGDDPKNYDFMLERAILRIQGMRKLIQDILDLTRIESGRRVRDLKPVDLVEIARKSIETISGAANEQQIAISLAPQTPLTMTADEGEIEIIFNNLISNAVKYNRPGGKVEVRMSQTPEFVRIAVSDTGIGMTPEECAKLFSDFVRIKNEKTRKILGSGLGLSILKKLSFLYGGDITVQSEPDVGSTFTVTLRKDHRANEPG